MMFWYGNGMSGWSYALMTIGTVLFWGLVIAGVIMLIRHVIRDQRTSENTEPEQILAERFARGEIDEQEYQTRLTTLRGGTRTRA